MLLTACVPRAVAFDAARTPDPAALGPNNAATEWWYVSGYLPDTQQAFHWAQFKVNYKGIPYFAAHLAITDLNTGKLTFLEEGRQDAKFSFPPLKVRQGDWTLTQSANAPAAPFALQAGPLQLTLTPAKGPVVHPPGYSGTPETGQLYYQSVTRLNVSGTIARSTRAGTGLARPPVGRPATGPQRPVGLVRRASLGRLGFDALPGQDPGRRGGAARRVGGRRGRGGPRRRQRDHDPAAPVDFALRPQVYPRLEGDLRPG